MPDSERKYRSDKQEFSGGELERIIAVLEREDAENLTPTLGDQVLYFFAWILTWILAVSLLFMIEPLSPPSGTGAGAALVLMSFGLIALIALLSIVVMIAVLTNHHRRRLRQIRELGIDDFYKTLGRIYSPANWTSQILLIITVIPVIWVFILVLKHPQSEEMALAYVIVLVPITMGLYFLGRGHQKLETLTDIKFWKRKLTLN